MKKILVFLLALSAFSLSACNRTTGDTDGDEAASNVSESALTSAGSEATISEGAAAPFITALSADYADDFQNMDYLDPQDMHSRSISACLFSTARSTCTSNVDTITWGGCTIGTASLTGTWTETWSAGFCANGAKPGALTSGNSVTRVTTSDQVLTLASGATVTTNTTAHTAWDGTSIPGTGVTTTMSGATRTIMINGLKRTMVGPKGRTWYNHSILTPNPGLSVTGTRAGANRVVNGTLTLFHNIARYKADHTFNAVTWGSSSCCYPTSGSITTNLTGSKTGSVTLGFTSTCGQATFTDTTAASSTVTLTQCN